MTIIMNTGRVPLQVGIIQISTGAKGSMRIMGRGRHSLMDGYKLDPNWMALYGRNIKVVEDKPIVAPVVAPTVKVTTTPAASTSTVTPAPTVSTASTDNKGAST